MLGTPPNKTRTPRNGIRTKTLPVTPSPALSATGDSQRDSREFIRANHSQLKPLFLKRVRPIHPNHSNFRRARITRFVRITPLSSCKSYRFTPSHLIVRYRRVSIALCSPQSPLSQPTGGRGMGYRSSSCPLEGIAL